MMMLMMMNSAFIYRNKQTQMALRRGPDVILVGNTAGRQWWGNGEVGMMHLDRSTSLPRPRSIHYTSHPTESSVLELGPIQ